MVDPSLNIASIASRSASLVPQAPKLPMSPMGGEGRSFGEILSDSLGEVQRLEHEADTTIRQLVAGEIQDPTEAMVAIEKADVAFQTMMAVRNKIVQAYEEVMRMQV